MPWVTKNVVDEVCSISPSNAASLIIWVVMAGGAGRPPSPPPHPGRLMAAQAMTIARVLRWIMAAPLDMILIKVCTNSHFNCVRRSWADGSRTEIAYGFTLTAHGAHAQWRAEARIVRARPA